MPNRRFMNSAIYSLECFSDNGLVWQGAFFCFSIFLSFVTRFSFSLSLILSIGVILLQKKEQPLAPSALATSYKLALSCKSPKF